jgi:NADH-quinone oxidoreductase subunit M
LRAKALSSYLRQQKRPDMLLLNVMLPDAAQSWLHVISILCLGNILYVGLVAVRQKQLNLLIGNSSVAHMGFIFLGIASLNLIGVTGAVVIMIAHGFLAALTFGLSGYIYQQTGTLEMDQLGGLLRRLPFIGAALLMAAFAGCGLPGFANFAGEVTVLFGAWKSFRLVTVLACWGALVIGAIYMLRAVRNILHGPVPERWARVADAPHFWRKGPFILLIASLMVFGCFPRLLSDKIAPSARQIVAAMEAGSVRQPLTPALSRGENPRSRFGDSTLFNIARALDERFPLPWGEGQGEGEWRAGFTRGRSSAFAPQAD